MSGYQVCGPKADRDDDTGDGDDRDVEFRVVCTRFRNAAGHVILAR